MLPERPVVGPSGTGNGAGYCATLGWEFTIFSKRCDYFVPTMGAGAEMLAGSTEEIADQLVELLKAKGGLR